MTVWEIRLAGITISVSATSGPAADLVALALSAMQAEPVTNATGIELSLDYQDEHWLLEDTLGQQRRSLTQPGDVIYHLTDRIVFHVADKATDVHCLHAAAVGHNGRALVVPANSGAGKSTFVAWLVANGFDYITDELILLNNEGGLSGIARPIQIKRHGMHAIEPLLSDMSSVLVGDFANALPISSLGGQPAQTAHTLAGFIFPQYRNGQAYGFEKLTSADAGMRLMANHVNARNLEGHGFSEMMRVIRNTSCFELEYGGFDTLPKEFKQLLMELMTRSDSV